MEHDDSLIRMSERASSRASKTSRKAARFSWFTSLALLLALAGCPPEDDKKKHDDAGAEGDGGDDQGDGDDDQGDGDDAGGTGHGSHGDGDGDHGDAGGSSDVDASVDHQGGGRPSSLPFDGNGISGKVDGKDYTYTTRVNLIPNLTTGTLQFGAYAPDNASHWVLYVPNAVGTYHCSDADGLTVLQLVNLDGSGGAAATKGDCTIKLLQADDDVYYATFEGTFETATANVLAKVTKGYLYYNAYSGPTGGKGLGANGQGISFLIGDDRWTYDAYPGSLAYETYAGMSAAPSDRMAPGSPIGIQLHTIPNKVGSYTCGQEIADYRAVNVWFYWKSNYYYAGSRQSATPDGPPGSSCKIKVTSVGTISGNDYSGTFAGTFSGTFVTNDGQKSITVTDGEFRLIK
jgi:hypothetical protein